MALTGMNMITINHKKFILKAAFLLAAPLLAVLILAALLCGGLTAYAASPVGGEDGVYSVPVDLSGLAMGGDNFSSMATVEKSGNNYYFTFGHSSSIGSMSLDRGDKQAGVSLSSEGGWTYYTYTLSESALQGSLSFSAYITAMSRSVSFTVKLNLSSAARTGDYTYEGERPAEFVPVIATGAGSEYQMQQGSVFPVPAATATLGSEDCAVTARAYYGNEEVTITDNFFTLEKVGEYRLVYRASSPSYQTNFGNDAYTEYEVKIISSAGGSMLAKFEDADGALPEGAALMAGRITTGAVYDRAAQQMKKVADNFEVFDVGYVTAAGVAANPTGAITLFLQADGTYDRTKAVVYHLDESGNLTRLEASGYGRYVKVETERTGTFIVCIPGVAFVMPMWGYAAILAACVVVVAGGAVTIIIVVRKKKKSGGVKR